MKLINTLICLFVDYWPNTVEFLEIKFKKSTKFSLLLKEIPLLQIVVFTNAFASVKSHNISNLEHRLHNFLYLIFFNNNTKFKYFSFCFFIASLKIELTSRSFLNFLLLIFFLCVKTFPTKVNKNQLNVKHIRMKNHY